MKKQITLSLLILSTTFAHAMEKESSFLNFFSWFSSTSNQEPNESKLITGLRKNINDFENQLKLTKWEETQKTYIIQVTFQPFAYIKTDPIIFIEYCYYQKFHETEMVDFNAICTDTSLLKKYQEVKIDGYSALGAAMLAKEKSIKEKRKFIEKLIRYGFKPTQKDMGIVELTLHDNITEHKKTFLHLLQAQPEVNWSVLPQEIRKNIAHYMIELFKKEFWLLPKIETMLSPEHHINLTKIMMEAYKNYTR